MYEYVIVIVLLLYLNILNLASSYRIFFFKLKFLLDPRHESRVY